jgi:ribose transport system ATP-binding protein
VNTNRQLVQMTNICKKYPGVQALKNASLTVHEGEIKALMGENGAGKSTLIRMLTGAEQPDSGGIAIDGQPVHRMTPVASEQLGIACVYQNLMLAEHLTVAENIWMGYMPSRFGLISKKALFQKTDKVLNEIGYHGIIDPAAKVADLTASQQGMVAIVRAISRNAQIVVFDEPTAVLADREVEELFRVIRLLREKGLAIIYISHRMEEIFEITDSITVLKDGQFAGEVTTAETNEAELIRLMVGRDLSASNYDESRKLGAEILTIENLCNANVSNCSLSLHEGEIVGIYGLVGAGRTELSRAIFGRDRIWSGKIIVRGQSVRLRSPRQAIDLGMSLIPEDRRRQGLAMQLSVKDNINLPVYRKHSRWGYISGKVEREICDKHIRNLAIKTPTRNQKVKNLSGGNQQKVVVGKWLANKSTIFLMDEPTNGIDVGAKEEIYKLINRLAHDGSGIVCVSSYMPELMDICDRILVMNSGRIVADVPRSNFNEEELLALAIKTADFDKETACV